MEKLCFNFSVKQEDATDCKVIDGMVFFSLALQN